MDKGYQAQPAATAFAAVRAEQPYAVAAREDVFPTGGKQCRSPSPGEDLAQSQAGQDRLYVGVTQEKRRSKGGCHGLC